MNTKGTGSIVQMDKSKSKAKCRRWQLRVSCGFDARNNRYKVKTKVVNGTYTQAQEAMRLFITELAGMDMVSGDMQNATLAQYVNYYLELRSQGRTDTKRVPSKSTVNKEKWNLNAFVRVVGGEVKIGRITPDVIRTAFFDMRSNGASGTYLSAVYASLNGMFKYAHKVGDTAINPVSFVDRPSVDTQEKRALTRAQIASLLNQLDPADMYPCAIGLIVTCGLRRSEVVRLTWGNVHDEELEIRLTKTRAGVRVLPLMPWAKDALAKRKEKLANDLVFFGECVADDMPVIANEAGEGITPHHLGVWWQKHRRGYGLDGWTLHELRHSFSSLLAASGASPKDIQELMGHASPDTALKIYTHTNTEQKAQSIGRAYESLNLGISE